MIEINKKAEMTTFQIVALTVLIVSFLVILYFLMRLNLGKTTDIEICRNSVVLKDKTSLIGTLDCKTQYVCISGGNDCTTISANEKINVKTKEDIMKALADKMSECWWEFGEDKKLVYAGGEVSLPKVYCAVCSIIAFDDKIQSETKKITHSEFYNYLAKTPKSNNQNYLDYLYGVSNVNDLQIHKGFDVVSSNDILTTEKYSVITGIDRTGVVADWLQVYLIPTSDTKLTTCTDFITKA